MEDGKQFVLQRQCAGPDAVIGQRWAVTPDTNDRLRPRRAYRGAVAIPWVLSVRPL